jgi:hypothetical protein
LYRASTILSLYYISLETIVVIGHKAGPNGEAEESAGMQRRGQVLGMIFLLVEHNLYIITLFIYRVQSPETEYSTGESTAPAKKNTR